MNDLDELASAARSEPAVRTPRVRRKRSKAPLVVGVSAAVAVVLGLGYWLVAVAQRPTVKVSDGAGGTRTLRIADARESDPGFSVDPHTCMGVESPDFSDGWIVTNKSERPLLVKRLIYNGEHEARLAGDVVRGYIYNSKPNKPVTLSIGDRQLYYEARWTDASPNAYTKEIIFVDVETDRGTFRYRPGEGRFASR